MCFTYFIKSQKKYAPEIGNYHSFDLVAYHELYRPPVAVLRDVTPDGNLALRMAQAFNKHQLSPIHLKDAVLDMLE